MTLKNEAINTRRYYIFILVFYLFVFVTAIEKIFPLMKYLDELYAVLAIPLFVLELKEKNGKIIWRKYSSVGWIVLFCLMGIISSMIYRYQPIVKTMLPDLLLNIKFWLSIYVSYSLFGNMNLDFFGKKIGLHIKIIVCIFVMLILGDSFIKEIFPGYIRYGFKSVELFYGHPTTFAAICVFLLALLCLLKQKVKNYQLFIITLCIFITLTMRSKAFGGIILFVGLYYMVFIRNKKINLGTMITIGIGCVIAVWGQLQFFFLGATAEGSARRKLLETSFIIAKDHFPLGSGFGTFASYFSTVAYSPLYSNYGISHIQGLSQKNTNFASDSFWPMIIAQTGYLGLLFYCMAILMLFKRIQKVRLADKNKYFAAMFSFSYLLISSIAEAAFVHPIAIPLAIVIGISLKNNDKELI